MESITGQMINYYFVCNRKLWYFLKGINFESESELVKIGEFIDKTTYTREKYNITTDELSIDFIKSWKIIHEVKKTKKLEESSIWQLKYYIWKLRQKGIDIEKGILDYPLLKKRKDVFLNVEDEEKLLDIINNINKIKELDRPPKLIDKKFCKNCAYYELCYI